MKIRPKAILKFILPYGIIYLYRKYIDYSKSYKKMDSCKKFVFDIILSVGPACRCAYYLKKHGLRFSANPLDWMMMYSLDTVAHLYKTRFNDFFIKFSKDEQKSKEHNCNWYIDIKNDIVSMHYDDVKNNKSFRDKMKTRFEKSEQMLLKAKDICFISNRNEDVNLIKKFTMEIEKLYSGNITYINIRNNKEMNNSINEIDFHKEKISKKSTLLEYEFNDTHPKGDLLKENPEAWIGNYVLWDKIMKKVSIKKQMCFLVYLLRGLNE